MKKYLTPFFFFLPFIMLAQHKVGINTIEPLFDLDVRGTDNEFDGGELQLGTPDQTNFLRFFGGRMGDRNPFVAFHDEDTFHIVTTSTDWLTFQRRLTMLPSGNVGIGTDNPQAKLDIAAVGDSAQLLRLSTSRPWVFRQLGTGSTTRLGLQTTVNNKGFTILSENGMNRVADFYANNDFSIVRLVEDGGNVGIGADVVESKLHIKHNSTIPSAHLRLTEDGDDFARIKMESTSNPGAFWDIAGMADTVTNNSRLNFFFSNAINSGDRMTITGIGNVGIGTTNPTAKLHVNGDLRVSDLTGSGDRNVVVDGSGKFKIGSVGVGDTDWNETTNYVTAQKPARVLTVTGTPPFTSSTWTTLTSGSLNKWFQLGVSSPGGSTLFIQDENDGDLNLVAGGGNVGIAIPPGSSRLTIEGPDNNGTEGTLEIRTIGGIQKMVLDGNEIDAVGGNTNLHLNANSNGPVSIGGLNVASGYKLSVHGKVIAEEMRVQLVGAWPDYVFSSEYDLPAIEEVEAHIMEKHHLPGIPTAREVEENGQHLGEMQRKMMEKIEELTLYVVQLNKKIKLLEEENKRINEKLTRNEH